MSIQSWFSALNKLIRPLITADEGKKRRKLYKNLAVTQSTIQELMLQKKQNPIDIFSSEYRFELHQKGQI